MTTDAVIITGSSRGIGAATAILAGRRSYAVCVNYRSNERAAEQLVATIRSSGGETVAVQADVSVESDAVRLFDTCEETFGKPRALVNNAGILETQMCFELKGNHTHAAWRYAGRSGRSHIVASVRCRILHNRRYH